LERYANLELFRGRPEHAVDLLGRLIKIVPDNPGVMNLYGRALVATGRGDDARDVLERSLAIDPDQPSVRSLLSDLDRHSPS
jgi:Flp pilus assembly protein TadD